MTIEKKLLYTGNYPIRWADIDMYGHVNHTIYLQYMVEVSMMVAQRAPRSRI